jgi:hypothetical protein
MKGVWPAEMQEWIVGMQAISLGPKIGAERRAQVEKVGVFEVRTRDSAIALI